ncbi:MAG: hypothetical protein HDR06_09005 [Lachnospiraceae bacterium]|nr:hypothetical protein [Lachnospiraceae bacterium]
MMSRKRMLSGKRVLAGILTAVMVISSVQLPMGNVYAEELTASVQEDENGNPKQESGEDLSSTDNLSTEDQGENEGAGVENPSQSDDAADGENPADGEPGEPSDGGGISDTDAQEPSDEEDISDTEAQEPSDEVNPSVEDDAASEDGEDGIEESDTGELYVTGISDNDLAEPDLQETMTEDEIDGAYQFGDAPSKRGNLSVYSVSAQSDEAEEYIYQQMLARKEMIDISAYNIPYDSSGIAMLRGLVSGVLNEHPDLYFVESGYRYGYTGTIITAIALTYNDTLDDAAVQRGIEEALATVDGSMSDLEKAIVLHDYLVVNCEYDKENLDAGTVPSESHSIYGVFAKRIAVCDGYALAYKYLLKRVGIDCYMVTSDSMKHAWNMIVLGGQYYQVDVTWDDPTWDKIGRAVHTYMFRSDSAFAEHQDWRITYGSQTVDYKATDTRYDNAFWTECDSPLVLVGDDCYYVSYDSTARQCAIKKRVLADFTDGGTIIQNIDRWTDWDDDRSYWQGAYSGLFRIGDRLYYNDKSSIYSIAMDGTDKRTEFTADTSTGYIYGSAYYQGNVLYALHQTPNLNGRETVLVASMGGSGSADIPVQLVELSAYTLELAEGDEAGLSVTIYPAYATDSAVVWTSDDETVAEVNNGIVRAISAGSCTITATAGGKKAECAIQVKGALDLNNLSYEYTTVDDTKISSAANGKPKLLIFYSNTCGNCRNTIRGISNKIDQFAGIDIYAMETNNGTKEAVAEFQSQYGCEEITFSYDQNNVNALSMSRYAQVGGMGTTISWPLICYIDANNRLQYMTMSLIAADEILSNLKKYCNVAGEAPQTYTITYVLNGGTNSGSNPSTYTSETDTIILRSATREGYQFEGWYKDSAYTIRVTQIVKGSTGNITLYAKWEPIEDESPIEVKPPAITTYKVGQKINLAGGTVTYPSGSQTKTVTLTAAMISGFDSTKPGICAVQVTCDGYTTSFDTLVVEEPKLTASAGQRISEVALPQNEYGTYTWQDNSAIMEKAGIYTFTAVFTPKDQTKFQKLTDIQVQVTAQEMLGADTDVTFKTNRFTYSGTEQEPKVVVRASDTVLTEGEDYTLSYSNNKNAGIATVTIEGEGCYLGSTSRTFEISPAQLVITAQDKTILIGDPVPTQNEYKYEVSGLMTDDALITEPAVACEIVSSTVAGQYDIVLSGADAGNNYIISYVNGKLIVASEYVSCTVTFDVQGHGTAPADYFGIKVGQTIDRPDDPSEAGYRFDGWYKDVACTKAWNFDTDIVQSDMILYAKWLGGSVDGEFTFQEIADVYYTGKACKPVVSVYDGDTLLKSGRDYQIRYYNNINANKGGVRKQGNGEGTYFNKDLPYVEIIGKGNYTDRIKDGNKDTVKVNFNILRTSIGDGSSQAADGIVLKVSDQLVTAKKAQKPFTSIKYVKGMKKDTDFKVILTVVNARNQSGESLQEGLKLEDAAVPAGCSGEFLLTIKGVGNYKGSICREIYVTDKAHLIKNATITIGKNLKNITFTGEPVQLKPAETDSADTFTVKYGKTFLKPGRDYTVSYLDKSNERVGKATLVITGMGEYAGSKTATFNIKGRAFTAKTVLVADIEDKVYTGRAITQNGAKLTYGTEAEELRYGTDYTISYSKNINKGTATMTFKGAVNAGYSGSFKKTFKITAADITQVNRSETMQKMVFNYCKAGVKPIDEILLTNQQGFILRNGKDYTLKYANNKAVASASAEKPPTVTVKGKGNYAGEFSLKFDIIRTDLRAGSIQIKTTPVEYKDNKAEDYAYKPAVKLTDGKAALRAGTDYEIAYRNNTQADYERYIQKLQESAGDSLPQGGELTIEDDVPMAVITEVEGSSYKLEPDRPIIVPLPIYAIKLTKANLKVDIGEAVYTGSQVTPEVTVSYDGKPLREGENYSLSYGANTASGKNKGSVVINGIAPNYGGSVTVKFDITKKPISY